MPPSIDPDLSKNILFMLAREFAALGLLAGGNPMEFIGACIQRLKRKHYRPGRSGHDADA